MLHGKGHCRATFYMKPSKIRKKEAKKPQFKGYLDKLSLFPLYSLTKPPFLEGKIFYRRIQIVRVKSKMKN